LTGPVRLAAVGVAALALAGCGSGSVDMSSTDASLQSLLIKDPPAGYVLSASGTGPMDVQTASYSTPAAVSLTASWLQSDHFKRGYSRVWLKGTDYITVGIYRFDTPAHAADFADFEKRSISGETGTYTYALSQPSFGTGFIITSPNKTKTKLLFCQGGVYPVDVDALMVETCGVQPAWASLAESLARQEYFLASGVIVAAAPSSSPSGFTSPSSSP
jgi:hypothetical protein